MKPSIKKIRRGLVSSILILAVVTMISLTYTRAEQQRFSDISTLVVEWNNRAIGLKILGFEYFYAPSERRYQRWKEQYASMAELVVQYAPYTDRYNHIPVIMNHFTELPMAMDKIHASALRGEAKEQFLLNLESLMGSIVLRSLNILRQVNDDQKALQEEQFFLFSILSLAGLAIVLLLVVLFHRWVDMPIKMLITAVAGLGKGKLHKPIKPLNSEELDLIVDQINASREELIKITVSRDELEQETEKRRVLEKRFRDMVESSSDWIWEIDIDGQYIYSSPAVEDVLGYSADDMLGKTPFDFMDDAEKQRVSVIFQRLSELSEPIKFLENTHLHRDGHPVTLETNAVPVFDQSGNRIGYRGVDRDITERKQLERERREYSDNLEKEVAQRTAALRRKSKELESANEDLEGFSYSVSHDLRSPLRAIDGFVNILEEDYASSLDEEGLRLLNVVSDNATKMGRLIDDILQFSRAGRLELELQDIEMNDLVDEVWAGLKEQRGDREIEFSYDSLPPVPGDIRALRQVVQNLLSNAIKFTRDSDPAKISVSATIDDDIIRYEFKDNGTGFNSEYVGKLFILFQRLHGMDEFEGTGVGLAIVKRFVQKHGGDIRAEGALQQGAKFTVSLPRTQAGMNTNSSDKNDNQEISSERITG